MNAGLASSRPLAPLSRRRRVVLLATGGYTVLILSIVIQELLASRSVVWLVLAVAGLVMVILGSVQLMRPARLGLPEGRDRDLDERQWQRLAQAHITAYRVLGVAFLLGSLYFYLAHNNGSLPLPTQPFAWMTIWMGAVLFIPTLPTTILAWTEPDLRE
ncbi:MULTISPECIES: hypothetical protein [Deinococcus]|uniref:Uncharacterized protein n=1 Tax=Deinococcus rufus TaxID=2136097 RepID=A0ABV7Z569_9DEIO|nr:hypothetical protein [Deinococcus sp. AB2017081]WQE95315.1 hypothetical protein U2P90_00095 [Deinococcus sp. AB2017081]